MKVNLLSTNRPHRAGLSVLEFLGCTIAVLGGAWLGALYLGIKLQHVAYVALTEAELLEQVPEKWRPTGPDGATKVPTSAELAKAVQTELVNLRGEISALRSDRDSQPSDEAGPIADATSSATSQEAIAKEQTLAYWDRIHAIVSEHAALQRDAESTATEGNATKLAALKGRINRFAASSLRAIPPKGVDPAASAVSHELADWYDRGGDLFDQAIGVWESASRNASAQVTKDWEFAQLQLRNEGRLLGDKLAAARDSLSRRFNAEFKDIPRP